MDATVRETTKHGPRMGDAMAEETSRLTGVEDATGLPGEGADDIAGEPAPPAHGARPSPPDAHLRALSPDIVFGDAEEVASAFGGIRSGE